MSAGKSMEQNESSKPKYNSNDRKRTSGSGPEQTFLCACSAFISTTDKSFVSMRLSAICQMFEILIYKQAYTKISNICRMAEQETFYLRVWSWLRMNAGGVPNTCKSNEAPYLILRMKVWWLSGGRVSNAWVTCPVQGDNSWKRLLIPHKRTRRHLLVWKTPVVQDGPASD